MWKASHQLLPLLSVWTHTTSGEEKKRTQAKRNRKLLFRAFELKDAFNHHFTVCTELLNPLSERQTDLHNFLSLQSFNLSGSALAVAVPVAQLAVIPVSPTEHLAALRQSHRVAVTAAGCHQLSHNKTWETKRTTDRRWRGNYHLFISKHKLAAFLKVFHQNLDIPHWTFPSYQCNKLERSFVTKVIFFLLLKALTIWQSGLCASVVQQLFSSELMHIKLVKNKSVKVKRLELLFQCDSYISN